ncbi:MAG: VOC family protein [Candidatus Dormibacteria bacterium]
MAETQTVTMNKPGWLDLSSTDAAASRDFYSKLFGWEATVIPDPAAGGYAMAVLDGKEVGGIGPVQNPEQPSAWTIYILVENADDAVTRSRDAGATVLMEPMEVMGQGRMAIIGDPSGAAIGLWQPMGHAGWEVEGVPGSVCWVELTARNFPAARKFYADVFGWTAVKFDAPDGQAQPGLPEYFTFKLGDADAFGGGLETPADVPAEVPSYWQPYFLVTDTDAMTEKAKELGATVLMGPAEAPNVGRWSILHDPQGAIFAVLQAPEGT